MSEGVIIGGWGYVIAAYSLTAMGFVGYIWSLHARHRRLKKED